jgi:squalene synthase HpnC
MTSAAQASSGKTHRDENFPVASRLIDRRHRGVILAFYRFVRAADDVADNASLTAPEKLALLDRLEQGLLGENEAEPDAVALRRALAARALSPRHAQDLVTAFRLDVTKRRYRDWEDLIGYCSYSAMPVGRFVLDVHGESRDTWPANDALCAALQVINHLQDCGADYRNLDRVYVPLDALAREGLAVEALGAQQASPALMRCLRHLAERTAGLLRDAEPLRAQVKNWRLGLEIAAIQRLARTLTGVLLRRDPLRERVHLTKPEFLAMSLLGIGEGLIRRALPGAAARARARKPKMREG